MQRIALLGGSSPLGLDLTTELTRRGLNPVTFSRFKTATTYSYRELDFNSFDCIVNLIGGHKSLMRTSGERDLILEFASNLSQAAARNSVPLLHLSSGILSKPQERVPERSLGYYKRKFALEKLHTDLRAVGAKIVDLRLFSFAGPNFLARSDYFLCGLRKSIVSGVPITISGPEFTRDFSGPGELVDVIQAFLQCDTSGVFDLTSSKPVARSELLESLEESFGLKFVDLASEQEVEEYIGRRGSSFPRTTPRSSLEVAIEEMRSSLMLKNLDGR